jgi:protein-tyrosine-phosphatase
MADRVFNTLFLCTGNSARSIMAEALLNTMGQHRFHAFSAGSLPTGKVNPFAIEKVKTLGYVTEGLRSKSWDEFAKVDAPKMDIIITVCDNAAGEVCPIWPGHPAAAHWGFPDPAAALGTDDDKRHAFDTVFHAIRRRMELLVHLPTEKIARLAQDRKLDQELNRIAHETA